MTMTIDRPQRITAPAKPGVLLKQFGPRPGSEQRSVKRDGYEDPDYLAMVRAMPCLNCGHDPCGEAAHVRYACAALGRSSGMGKKPRDRDALPLCADCHRLSRSAQHNHNERGWWEERGMSPYLIADKLYAQRGDLVAMRAVIFVAVAERSRK